MATSNTAEDLLNLPDDEFPDYPPGDEPEVSSNDDNDTQEDVDNDLENNEAASTAGESEETDTEEEEESDSETESGHGTTEGTEETSTGSSEEDTSEEGEQEEGTSEEEDPEEVDAEASEKPLKASKSKSKTKGKESKATEQTLSPGADVQLQQLFAPFKANGHDMQVGSIEDARTLMQMGANYNKKMNGLKPNLKLIKMLENEQLLDEEKLSFLIDLQNKNPEAIAKLIKDSGFDALNYDEDKPTDYKPNTYTVNEKEVDLDMVLTDIEDSPSFKKTIDAISNKWDAASKQNALDDPNLIRTINSHMESGMYDQVMNIVYNEKALGRLTNMSDLEAYKHVGDTLQAQGAFDQQPPANEVPTTPKPKAQQDPKLKNRKKAAAPTRSKPAKKQNIIDPLALSDEDFNKMSATMQF